MSIPYSEAIRLGGMLAPKAKWVFYDGRTGAMCVQGAALQAIGKLHTTEVKPWTFGVVPACEANHEEMEDTWPQECLNEVVALEDLPSPFTVSALSPFDQSSMDYLNKYGMSIVDGSMLLNNYTDLTREEIADWVEMMGKKYGIGAAEQVGQGAVAVS